jgi:hypothetical protein
MDKIPWKAFHPEEAEGMKNIEKYQATGYGIFCDSKHKTPNGWLWLK